MVRLAALDPSPDEIIVWLDGCTDGLAAMLAGFPNVTVVRSNRCEGSIPARDTAFRMARGDLVVSLDDDSSPLQGDFVARLVAIAQRHPEAGAFAFHEVRPDVVMPPLSRGEVPRPAYISPYPNCAGAIRKELYGELTAYPRFFSHAYAEPDFCLQVYAAGYAVLYVPELEIFHLFTGTLRDMKARHLRNARNEFWSMLMRCPFPHVVWVAAYRLLRQFVFAASRGWLKDEPRWWDEALRRIDEPLRVRRPVSWPLYWHWMRMARMPLPARRELLAERFPNVRARWIDDLPAE